MTQENALKIFKSLSDMSRLRIVRSLTQGEMYTELLAERLDLTPSTVSFHMKKLEEAGLVVSRKEQYYTVYSLNRDVLERSLFEMASSEPEQIDEQQKREEEYRKKVIDSFFEYGKLRSIPVQRKKKQICYEVIAEHFVPGKVYSEKELDDIIAPIHEDYCTIRRDMISEGILRRDGNEYVRIK
ncbi:MAG: metalloregulator ArsR/SmtB family transcription factor [Oscillospiraceae bacterium]|nr:metalloregulator ArsR/SmtB family transcription factor [Oscillospiraceae bacterium]